MRRPKGDEEEEDDIDEENPGHVDTGEREHENHDPGLEAEPTKEVEMEDIAADPEGTGESLSPDDIDLMDQAPQAEEVAMNGTAEEAIEGAEQEQEYEEDHPLDDFDEEPCEPCINSEPAEETGKPDEEIIEFSEEACPADEFEPVDYPDDEEEVEPETAPTEEGAAQMEDPTDEGG